MTEPQTPGSLIPSIPVSQLQYHLPKERIAFHPTDKRDESRLLVWNQKPIADDHFSNIISYLPQNSLLVFNNAKVIPARLIFQKGEAWVEVFLLNPLTPDWSQWECFMGNRRKFKESDMLRLSDSQNGADLCVQWLNRDLNFVRFSTGSGLSFPELIDQFGKIPLPPYIRRDISEEDAQRYQTVFAEKPGAVAAPTASLHFTTEQLQALESYGIQKQFLTLYVGAGTFKPVTADLTNQHQMHSERFTISRELIQKLAAHQGPVIPVGTTAMRVLESIHYIGAGLITGRKEFNKIEAHFGYDNHLNAIPFDLSVQALQAYFADGHESVSGETAIYILPGFHFRLSDAIITNFHQPGSTLLGLVSAFVGEQWREIYAHALRNNYRFLSFGDTSLLFASNRLQVDYNVQ